MNRVSPIWALCVVTIQTAVLDVGFEVGALRFISMGPYWLLEPDRLASKKSEFH